MNLLLKLSAAHTALGRLLDHLQSLALLATRFYVGWQLARSGWLKLTAWSSTLEVFTSGHHVPLLTAAVAAVAGFGGALLCAALLFLGLFARVGALGALLLDTMAVISYRQVLLAAGSEAALARHLLWGFMLAVLVLFGPGRIAVDTWLERRCAARCRPLLAALPT